MISKGQWLLELSLVQLLSRQPDFVSPWTTALTRYFKVNSNFKYLKCIYE